MSRPVHPILPVVLVVLIGTACSADMREDSAALRRKDLTRTIGHGQAEAVHQACFLGEFSDDSTCFSLEPVDGPIQGYHYPDLDDDRYPHPVAYLDLEALPPDAWLSPAFRLREFAQAWKGRWAVVQPRVVQTLQDLRDEVGPISINSGYRSPAYNRTVNGSYRSRHMYGDGVDFRPLDTDLQILAQACHDHEAGFVEIYQTHVHCDWRDERNDVAFFGASHGGNGARTVAPSAEELGRDATIVGRGERLFAETAGFDEGDPLIEWTAYDQRGEPIVTSEGADFAPPMGATTVVVRVGGVLTRTHALD